jgi:SAM-dependent methyltransferase
VSNTIARGKEIINLAKETLRNEGLITFVVRGTRFLLSPITASWYRHFHIQSFNFEGTKYDYFYHHYNETYRSERCVEIPIAYDFIDEKSNTLEVGNVLSHYFDVEHTIVDKYETRDGIINKDILRYDPDSQFDSIVSISTVEHIGEDEHEETGDKAVKAIQHMKSLLTPGGSMLITFPIGHNHYLDKAIKKRTIGAHSVSYLKRVEFTKWRQAQPSDVWENEFENYPFANAICVVYFCKE